MSEDESKHHDPEQSESPPGHFVSDDLRTQTARFLDELKRRLGSEKPEPEPKLGPPPPK
ncbi:MAG: hypothetical protein M3R57_08500 [Chloroflexota bacterium]|nr:hypothetical protein [Chloroflexota bacterium]